MEPHPTAAWDTNPAIQPVDVFDQEKTPANPPIPVYATIHWLAGRTEVVEAVATGWTRTTVCINWTNAGVMTMGWVPAGDVRRRTPR